MADHQIREAAESLLSSVSNPHHRTSNQSQSVNLVAEDVLSGHRPDGRMSTVRRFFCLFVTFDVLFTSLIWLICVMMRGETLRDIVDNEILHYNVRSSLFDIVMAAICRFTVLLLFYALLYINNWSVIALSTGGTCAFLIAKVFVYDWPSSAQQVYQVFLILTSFTIAWGEAWFLDFRVLPQESQAKHILSLVSIHHAGTSAASERTPLLQPGRHGPAAASTFGESTVNWFSPVDTPDTSPRPKRPGREVILTQDQIDEYIHRADESVRAAWEVMHRPGWRVEKRGAVRGDVVECVHADAYGKVYRFTGIVDCPAHFLYAEFKDNITKLPEWNPTILKTEMIKVVGPGVDLSYQVTAGGGRGIVAPRDFVILRRTAALDRDGNVVAAEGESERGSAVEPYAYITSGVSVDVPGYPPTKDYVRGNNKIGCWFMKPTAVKTSSGRIEQKCTFQWLMCCDLKGKIPQFVLDTAFATVMMDYIVHVRQFASSAKSKGLF